ncbi:hypothetical protein HGRIS_003378 [Hohenbuehelia grisea]|uniref:Ubiquitin-like protease family profile domain-containing protein n=1 Tax=Hohenbuehelia grisea TaxID=104357 RepID=A0ABR3JFA3_9AGAR
MLMPRLKRLTRAGEPTADTVSNLCSLTEVFNSETLRSIKKILIPVNHGGSHWILVHCNLVELVVEILDSRADKVAKKNWPSCYNSHIKNVCLWLKMLDDRFNLQYEDPITNPEMWSLRTPFPVKPANTFPYQKNDDDCGMFVIMYAKPLLTGNSINHDGVPDCDRLYPIWDSLDHFRLRLWMELPKGSDDWASVLEVLRDFGWIAKYKPLAPIASNMSALHLEDQRKGVEIDVDALATWPLLCPVCQRTFVSAGGTRSHLKMLKNCSWWLTEAQLRLKRRDSKGKGKMLDPASSLDYALVPEMYPDEETYAYGVSYDDVAVVDAPPEERPEDVLEELEEEELFRLVPGFVPYDAAEPSAGPSGSPADSKVTGLSLDEDEDERSTTSSLELAWTKPSDPGSESSKAQDAEGDVTMESANLEGSSSETAEPVIPNRFAPFASELDWQVAHWFVREEPGHTSFDKLLALPGVVDKLGLSFKNVRELWKTLEELPERSGKWQAKVLTYPDRPDEKFVIRFRNPIEMIKSLWGDPSLADNLVHAPSKVFTDRTRTKRVFSEMWTGTWWNTLQETLRLRKKHGATIAPVILASDKTQLSQFSGSRQAHPVYLTLGNIPKAICRKPTRHACVLLGYLSTDKINTAGLGTNEVKSRAQRIFHNSLRLILEPLKQAGVDGVDLADAKGDIRRVFPVLASYVTDYPEQTLLACSKYTTCPKCQADAKELDEMLAGPP